MRKETKAYIHKILIELYNKQWIIFETLEWHKIDLLMIQNGKKIALWYSKKVGYLLENDTKTVRNQR